MSRSRIILPLVLLTAVAVSAACGGGSSGGSSASLENGDVAVVGDTHITQKQLDQLVAFQVNLKKVAGQTVPAAGTAAYKTQVVDPTLQGMVSNARVENIAKQLGVTVSDSEVNAGLQKGIQAQFGTDTAKYQAYLKKYAITEDYLKQQVIRPQLLQAKIIAKLKSQYKVTDAQVQAYYNAHKSQYVTPDTRKVHYILTKDQADANAARKALIQGSSFPAEVKKYSLDAPNNPSGALTARQGQVETNFANAVFAGLVTGGISPPVQVDSSYAASNLAGKCKPNCYFVIRADDDTVKGSQQSYAAAKAQILSQLEQSQETPKLQKKIQSLLAAQIKLTNYASAYKPAATASTSGGTSP
jgi:foldase protein PrsA